MTPRPFLLLAHALPARRAAAVCLALAAWVTGLAPGLAMAAPPAQPEPDLRTDDTALIAHLKKTDYVFSTALGDCSGEKLVRHHQGHAQRFEYTAFCAARAAVDSDCPGYEVRAKGTVDTKAWATVREVGLRLKCSG